MSSGRTALLGKWFIGHALGKVPDQGWLGHGLAFRKRGIQTRLA
jgi:hypothetical protein